MRLMSVDSTLDVVAWTGWFTVFKARGLVSIGSTLCVVLSDAMCWYETVQCATATKSGAMYWCDTVQCIALTNSGAMYWYDTVQYAVVTESCAMCWFETVQCDVMAFEATPGGTTSVISGICIGKLSWLPSSKWIHAFSSILTMPTMLRSASFDAFWHVHWSDLINASLRLVSYADIEIHDVVLGHS